MLRLVVAATIPLTAGASAPAAAQAVAAFQGIRDWDADGAKAEPTGNTLRLVSGAIWSPSAFDDFVLRFDYRPLSAGGGGTLRLRSTIDADRTVRSFDVVLDHGAERGRLDGIRQAVHELTFARSPAIADMATWVAVEVRAEQDRLTVSLDGVAVTSADRTEAYYGTIGFAASKGGIELRGMRVAALKEPTPLSAALPRAGNPGVTIPEVIKREHPAYSRAAMQARAQGIAKVEFVIEADGSPGSVRVLEPPHPDLALASIACVRRWKFTPPLKDGAPAAILATMELSFKLK